RRYRISQKWNLLYSLDQHGISLASLYSLTREYNGPCIMIIKDADKQIFGSYLSNTLSSQSHYYGTGECFLWKLSSASQKDVPKIKTFPWTGKNDYMILSDSDFIAIGGGNGTFGLWLNSELEKGYSNACPTFDNECLSTKPDFECMEMEIWGFST
ncbi:TLDc domain-containing protein, partial [Pilaira anomala]